MAEDPDVRRFLDFARASGRRPFEELSVAEARAAYLAGRHTLGLEPVPLAEVTDHALAVGDRTLRLRRYLPHPHRGTPQPAILFFHGGGWVIGDLDTHDAICRRLAVASGRQVVAVDYRLAPEHRFPAAVADAVDAHAAVLAHAERWAIDPARIVLAGDSAGGTLAIVVALGARDLRRPPPAAQLLFYPVTDLRGGTRSYVKTAGVPITGRTMAWFRGHYLNDAAEAADWRASPLLAATLRGSPPTFLTVAGHDPLHDEGVMFAERLRAAGVPVTVRALPHQIHGYLTLGRMIGEAQGSIEAAARFLRP